MTRKEQLKFCSVCKHRKMNAQQGLLCALHSKKYRNVGEINSKMTFK